jgi:hypothetical protein
MFRRLLALVILFASHIPPVQAGRLEPSFSLDYCTWHATNIVVVRTTSQDGLLASRTRAVPLLQMSGEHANRREAVTNLLRETLCTL